MRIRYSFEGRALCPVDGSTDVYEVELRSRSTLPVERVLRVFEELTQRPLFQEDLAEALAWRLRCRVRVAGVHSGVRVVVRAGGPP